MTRNAGMYLTIALFLFFSPLVFAETGPRVFEHTGNFSFCPPSGWNVTEFPGLKYKVMFGPVEGNFATNINFVDEIYNGNLRSYVDISIVQLELYFQAYNLLSRDTFVTNSGIMGERVIIYNVQQGFFLRQVFYFLPAPNNRYIVITCSVSDNVATQYIPVFEECIKTFELLN